MTKEDKVKNIMTFLCILFGENFNCMQEIFNFSPDYIIEKFERYVLSNRPEHEWGMHPNLRRELFDTYCKKWELKNNKEN